MASRYVLGVDQGTTSSRAILFDTQGRMVREAKRAHRTICTQPGWVENDPLEIRDNVCACLEEVLEATDGDGEVAAAGITGQRETTVVWERDTGKPIYNAISWQDARTAGQCQRLRAEGLAEPIRSKTGLALFPYFSATKLQWILENVEGARQRAETSELLFGTVDTWLIWWLTGGPGRGSHVTDPSNASRTMLFNLQTLDWDDELLALFGVPRQMLPQVVPSSAPKAYGDAIIRGGRFSIPVMADIGDQQAALVGQTCFLPGEVKNSYGTANAILMNTGSRAVPSRRGLITTVAYTLASGEVCYALEGPTGTTGAAVEWLKSGLELIDSLEEAEPLARSVAENGGVYFVPAFSGLYAPYWDLDARGTIVGLTHFTKRAHVVRATLEAICYQTRDVIEAMVEESGHEVSEIRADGGATRNAFLMQLQADILGRAVRVSANLESTCLGAAFLAGLAAGVWPDLASVRPLGQTARVYTPQWDEERRRESYRGWRAAVTKARCTG